MTRTPVEFIDCDLDGVLCQEVPYGSKVLAPPNKLEIKKINQLYYDGWGIIIHTARGWGELAMTKYWLDSTGVKYDHIVCGKPVAKYRIDDRSFKSVEELWKHLESA